MGRSFVHRIRVRYSECDQQGVVFNGHYLFYYDVAVTELWREAMGTWSEMVGAGYDLMVAEVRLAYRDGARFDEIIDIELRVARLGVTSMVINAVFRVEGRLIAEGEMRHVFIDPATRTKKEMSPAIRAALQPYARSVARTV